MGDLVHPHCSLDCFATRPRGTLNVDVGFVVAFRHGHRELSLRVGGRASHDVTLGVMELHRHALVCH